MTSIHGAVIAFGRMLDDKEVTNDQSSQRLFGANVSLHAEILN